ncbi:MAG: DUF2085 domain-containing protein [Anaerolineae bacterium]|nr:DUF2085 domain-containing protein [Anaerolineae bacterium]
MTSKPMNELTQTPAVGGFRRGLVLWLHWRILWLSQHWLAVFNTFFLLYVGLPFLAPVLLANGYSGPAHIIYSAYQITCHQFPSRAYFIEGEQVALCQRDIAIYATLLGGGLIFSLIRHRLKPLALRWYVFFLVPIALDAGMAMASEWLQAGISMMALWAIGFIAMGLTSIILRSQNYLTWHSYLFFAFGPLALLYLHFFFPHQSNLLLRNLTGFILGAGTVWYLYPPLEDNFRDIQAEVTAKLARASA